MEAMGIISGVVVYVFVVAILALLLWWLIRSAVRRALRDHQLWLDSRHG